MGIGFCIGLVVCLLLAKSGVLFVSKRFESFADKALYTNSNKFMELADKYFGMYVREAKKDFDIQGSTISKSVEPVKESLDKYERRLLQMEKERENAFGAITERLMEMGRTQGMLQLETANLVKALRVPHVRGRWGEMTLKRVAQLAGMTEYCDFFEQVSSGSGKGALRPDMVVTLPGNRNIVVDAKVPLMAYLDALEARDESERLARIKDHGRQVKNHIKNLSAKSYTQGFSPTPEFVVLFIPGENFFSAALEADPELIEAGVAQGVVLATPTTLIALLKAVSYSWKQKKSWESAETIRSLGVELYSRLCKMTENINALGSRIEKCARAYNRTVGAMESRVMVTAKKLEDLDISSIQMEEPEKIEETEIKTRTFNTRYQDEESN